MHSVATHLTRAMPTHEDHVFESIHADRTRRVVFDVLQLLLQLLYILCTLVRAHTVVHDVRVAMVAGGRWRSSAADDEGRHVFDSGATLNTLLHETATRLTRTHVTARLE